MPKDSRTIPMIAMPIFPPIPPNEFTNLYMSPENWDKTIETPIATKIVPTRILVNFFVFRNAMNIFTSSFYIKLYL